MAMSTTVLCVRACVCVHVCVCVCARAHACVCVCVVLLLLLGPLGRSYDGVDRFI